MQAAGARRFFLAFFSYGSPANNVTSARKVSHKSRTAFLQLVKDGGYAKVCSIIQNI